MGYPHCGRHGALEGLCKKSLLLGLPTGCGGNKRRGNCSCTAICSELFCGQPAGTEQKAGEHVLVHLVTNPTQPNQPTPPTQQTHQPTQTTHQPHPPAHPTALTPPAHHTSPSHTAQNMLHIEKRYLSGVRRFRGQS